MKTDLYFTSDGYLYHKISYHKLNFKSPLSRQDFSQYFPVNKVVNGKVYSEKKLKMNLQVLIEMAMIKTASTEKDLIEMDLT